MSPLTIELMKRAGRALDTTETVRRELDRTLAAIRADRAERDLARRESFTLWPRQGPQLSPRGPAWPERSR